MQTNSYNSGYAGTLKIAKSYLKNTDGYSYEYENNNMINIYFSGQYIGNIKGQSPSINNISGVLITKDKIKTEILFHDKGISTTKSILFKKMLMILRKC